MTKGSGIDFRDSATGADERGHVYGDKKIPGPFDKELKQTPPPLGPSR